jgi:hypothetical protein
MNHDKFLIVPKCVAYFQSAKNNLKLNVDYLMEGTISPLVGVNHSQMCALANPHVTKNNPL